MIRKNADFLSFLNFIGFYITELRIEKRTIFANVQIPEKSFEFVFGSATVWHYSNLNCTKHFLTHTSKLEPILQGKINLVNVEWSI